LALAETHDIYGAMWLTGQCARMLADHLPGGEIRSVVLRYLPRVESLGFTPLQTRVACFASPVAQRFSDTTHAFSLESANAEL
jgi:hypothetical protein